MSDEDWGVEEDDVRTNHSHMENMKKNSTEEVALWE